MREYRYIDGTLRQGYYCYNCGQSAGPNGHRVACGFYQVLTCAANPKLVDQLRKANPPIGVKPRFIRPADIKVIDNENY